MSSYWHNGYLTTVGEKGGFVDDIWTSSLFIRGIIMFVSSKKVMRVRTCHSQVMKFVVIKGLVLIAIVSWHPVCDKRTWTSYTPMLKTSGGLHSQHSSTSFESFTKCVPLVIDNWVCSTINQLQVGYASFVLVLQTHAWLSLAFHSHWNVFPNWFSWSQFFVLHGEEVSLKTRPFWYIDPHLWRMLWSIRIRGSCLEVLHRKGLWTSKTDCCVVLWVLK